MPRTQRVLACVHDSIAIRNIITAAFASRSLAGIRSLLGFEAGARGTLACLSFDVDALTPADIARIARTTRAQNLAQLQLYIFTNAGWDEVVIASFGLGDLLLTLRLQRDHVSGSDVETLQEMIPAGDEKGSALAARHGRALDRARITRRFFSDFAAQRDLVADGWTSLAPQLRRDRDQLALLLLSRLMFLYFLQHRGYLAGDHNYLINRLRAWQRSPDHRRTFYSAMLKPLFFFVLNRRAERRPARAQSFGDLPYLNGGLFERHSLERKHARLDLPDERIAAAFDDLLERYRFTAREAADAEVEGVQDAGVDPEMLGRVFEGLMADTVRQTTGTFYTPAPTVDRLVRDSLHAYLAPRIGVDAATTLVTNRSAHHLARDQQVFTAQLLRETRVLDPACGSGAFLLGTLTRIAQIQHTLGAEDVMSARRHVVAHSLYGVDVQSDAAQLCALRLWLALVPGTDRDTVQPLPNLDRQIRQGDSLVDPIDLRGGSIDSEVRRRMSQLQPVAAEYVHSEPEQRPTLQRKLLASERHLARAWVGALQRRMKYEARELRAAADQKDLFGARTSEAVAATTQLSVLRERANELRGVARRINADHERPFFSFAVHFPDAATRGFDIVVCNPPWVRSHNWSNAISALVRKRFAVCRGSSSVAGGNQVDLAMLFLERAIDLLAPGGVLGIILPAKFMRSLSGSTARRLLMEQTDIVSIEDHSLDQRSIFQADAFAALIVARKVEKRSPAANVAITTIKRKAEPLRYTVAQKDLPLLSDDAGAAWLLVPLDVRRAVLRMMKHPNIGSCRDLAIRRGIVTGSNGVHVLTDAKPKLGGLMAVRAEGHRLAINAQDYDAIIEQSAVAPLIRGCDVGAWAFRSERFIICRTTRTPEKVPRTVKFLQRHGASLACVRVNAQHIVAWHDLASTLKAVVVPAQNIALNTVYYIALEESDAHLLCAYFNSLPVRVFARAIAERAKDAHFRFFASTIALVPLPSSWRSHGADRLRAISRAAHAAGAISPDAQRELDQIVASAYEIGRADMRALADFDTWLRPA